MTDQIMFATDYPHWDFDSPDRALPTIAGQAGAGGGSCAGNAHALYRLSPVKAPAGA